MVPVADARTMVESLQHAAVELEDELKKKNMSILFENWAKGSEPGDPSPSEQQSERIVNVRHLFHKAIKRIIAVQKTDGAFMGNASFRFEEKVVLWQPMVGTGGSHSKTDKTLVAPCILVLTSKGRLYQFAWPKDEKAEAWNDKAFNLSEMSTPIYLEHAHIEIEHPHVDLEHDSSSFFVVTDEREWLFTPFKLHAKDQWKSSEEWKEEIEKVMTKAARNRNVNEEVVSDGNMGSSLVATVTEASKKATQSAVAWNLAAAFESFPLLVPTIIRGVTLIALSLFSFAVVGMELFAGQDRIMCDGGELDEWGSWPWYECSANGDTGLNFENFSSSLLTLCTAFATADITISLNSTALLPYGRSVALYWCTFYVVENIIIFNIFSASMIDM